MQITDKMKLELCKLRGMKINLFFFQSIYKDIKIYKKKIRAYSCKNFI